MTRFVIIDGDGNEHTEPVDSEQEAEVLLERANEEGTLDYSIKTIGHGFH